MTKKQLVVHILTKLQPYREDASEILAVVQDYELPEHLLDMLLKAIHGAVKRVKSKKLQTELEGKLDFVEKLQQTEALQHQKDQEEADALLDELDA